MHYWREDSRLCDGCCLGPLLIKTDIVLCLKCFNKPSPTPPISSIVIPSFTERAPKPGEVVPGHVCVSGQATDHPAAQDRDHGFEHK